MSFQHHSETVHGAHHAGNHSVPLEVLLTEAQVYNTLILLISVAVGVFVVWVIINYMILRGTKTRISGWGAFGLIILWNSFTMCSSRVAACF